MPIQPWMGEAGTMMRPLKKNLKEVPKGAVLVDCPVCGEKCYKMPSEPDPLPAGVKAACTECALKVGRPKKK